MSFLIGELVLYLVLAALIGAVVGFGLGRVTRSRPATTVMFLEADGSSSTASSAPTVTDELGEDGDGQRAVVASPEASAGGLGAVVGVGGGDDLTRINGVSARFEQALQTMGYSTFSSIAAWSRDDIRRVAAEIDLFPDRIVQDRWVEQAAALAAHADAGPAAGEPDEPEQSNDGP